jgi:XTP/dITP diphosphohydrolase
MMELVLATENLHKIREFREMFKQVKGIDILSLAQFPDYTPPDETGETFSENAELKALHAAKHLNRIVLADDSGLVVPGLQGAPGVYSRRYAGGNATDAENRRKLLSETQHLEGESRGAYFECALAIATPEGIKKSISAKVEGLLLTEERGKNGFGYDPIFQKYDSHLTFAELDEATKNRISHRHKALQKILPVLEALSK